MDGRASYRATASPFTRPTYQAGDRAGDQASGEPWKKKKKKQRTDWNQKKKKTRKRRIDRGGTGSEQRG